MSTQASGADVDLFFSVPFDYCSLLNIWAPLSLGVAHGMTDFITETFGLAANIALHDYSFD